MNKPLLTCALCMAALGLAPAAGAQSLTHHRPAVAACPSPANDNADSPRPMRHAPASSPLRLNSIINPFADAASKTHKSAPQGALLWQSFENLEHEGDLTWLPEGWTALSKGDADLSDSEKWGCSTLSSPYLPAPADGDWYMGISFSSLHQDEWLVSPAVALPADKLYQLSFYAFISPAYFYDMGEGCIDWNKMEFVNQEIICNFQVLVSADGGEFEVVRDFAEENMGRSLSDLLNEESLDLRRYSVDLGAFKGKSVKVAFRYVGTDGNTMFLDAVSIALPEMDIAIAAPAETLYWGLDCSPEWGAMNFSVAQYPVYSPFTFSAADTDSKVDFSWLYCDPATTEMVPAQGKELTLEYRPDYTSEFTTRNNLYYPPVLIGSAEGYSTTETTFDVRFLQAGGKAEMKLADGSMFEGGLLTFDPVASGIAGYAVDDPEIGDLAIPIFGYNSNADAFWTNYTFRGEAEGNDHCAVTAIFNYMYPSAAPMVVDKVWLNAIGRFDGDVEFTCAIHRLEDYVDEDGEWLGYTIAESPLATATLKGNAAVGFEANASSNLYLTLPFAFDTPVVMSLADAPAYIVKISGFHNPKVEYFMPMQQLVPSADKASLGWIEKEITFTGQTRSSLSPISYFENQYGPMFCSFAINLGATYPWLKAEKTDLVLDADGTCTVALDSYYDAADLTVECPEWTEVAVSGRYGDCSLTVTGIGYSDDALGTITVSAPGVSQTFAVGTPLGIRDAAAEAPQAEIADVFTVAGVRVAPSPAGLAPGVYVVRRTDGSHGKTIVK